MLFIPDHFLGNLMTSLKKIIRTLVISSTFYPSEGESFRKTRLCNVHVLKVLEQCYGNRLTVERTDGRPEGLEDITAK